jgi:hypothetical protein
MAVRRQSGVGAKRAVGVAAVVIFLGLYVTAYQELDAAGWIPHRLDTTVYSGTAGWTSQETRDCVALPQKDGSIFFLGCVGRSAMEAAPQALSVTYWGRIKRPAMFKTVLADPGINSWRWRCRRKQDSLTCWAVN